MNRTFMAYVRETKYKGNINMIRGLVKLVKKIIVIPSEFKKYI